MLAERELEKGCVTALKALYLAVQEDVADDVNKKVYAYVTYLKMRPGRPRSVWFTMVLVALLGYVLSDLFTQATHHYAAARSSESFGECQPLAEEAERAVHRMEECATKRKSKLENTLEKVG